MLPEATKPVWRQTLTETRTMDWRLLWYFFFFGIKEISLSRLLHHWTRKVLAVTLEVYSPCSDDNQPGIKRGQHGVYSNRDHGVDLPWCWQWYKEADRTRQEVSGSVVSISKTMHFVWKLWSLEWPAMIGLPVNFLSKCRARYKQRIGHHSTGIRRHENHAL